MKMRADAQTASGGVEREYMVQENLWSKYHQVRGAVNSILSQRS
jgi:hypothetical protein